MRINKEYNRDRAVEYAKRWAYDRNPLFENFTGRGGDCTNFVSQCVYAGSCVMNYTPTFGWYFINDADRAPAWSGVNEFYNFMTGNPDFTEENGGIGPYGREVSKHRAALGDVVQLANKEGEFYHSLLVTGYMRGELLVSAHSNDALDVSLSTYNYASLRVIHIEGVIFEINDDFCFENLINGIEI